MDGSSSGLPVSKKPRKPSTPSAGALVSLAEEEEDDEVPLIMRRASSSLISSSTSSLPPVMPTSSELRDSQHSVDEVAAGASELPGGVADLVAPEVTVAVAPGSSGGLAPASLEVALVAPASPQPASFSPSLASGGPSISGDVVQQFDATHRLSELTAAWGSLSTLASSFGEKLQSFSRDHSGFFFSSENERKLSSEVDALKADLDLLRAELETERQVHQKEEKTLRARVVETEKQRDAAVESAKNECKALRVEKQKLSEGIEEMKALVRSSHNKAEEAQKTIENLSGKLATATENWNALWKSFRSVADVLRTPADDGQSWAQFIPRIPTRFQEFAKRCAQVCTKNVLAQVRVLAPEAPLSKIAEEAESQEYLDAVEKMEPEVEDLASRVVDSLSIDISFSDDNA
ncbi:WEB family protein At5g55860-like isoform X2 [Miscanthus floridulus]|uniref:WEB family protein At5g55860-like isoform X2 n=1 Tax=Miscanthus floridulus TaxID=154761 RepID=UPI003459D5A8